MRRSKNVTYVTLAVVCLVTIMAVTIALIRSGGSGDEDHHSTAERNHENTLVDTSSIGEESGQLHHDDH